MIMVTGGAYQGKEEFAVRSLGVDKTDVLDGGSCGLMDIFSAKCIRDYQEVARRLKSMGHDPLEFTARLCRDNSGAVVIMDEVGCGIVPTEKDDRIWREDCGRCGTLIAAGSEAVYRVCCGIAVRIK